MANTKTQGCVLGLFDTTVSPNAYVALAGVTDFQMGSSRNVISANTLASTAAEKVAGLLDNGNVQFNGKFQASDGKMVDTWDAAQSGTEFNWRVVFSDSPQTTFTFAGFVSNFSHSVSADSIVTVSGTVEITGAITDNLA